MKNKLLHFCIYFIFSSAGLYQVAAQPSFLTQINFRLLDEQGDMVDMEKFKREFSIEDIFCNTVDLESSHVVLRYDSGYFNYTVHTIGSAFSFALRHHETLMVIFLPFSRQGKPYYTLDIPMIEGDFLLDFRKRIRKKSETSGYKIKKVNWDRLRKKYRASKYGKFTFCYRKKYPFN